MNKPFNRPKYSLTSGNEPLPSMGDPMFGLAMDTLFDDFEMNITDDAEGFREVPDDTDTPKSQDDTRTRLERTGDDFNKTMMVPFMIATDGNTATQVAMLLEMIRYCMENSKDVIDSTTGENRTYDIHLKVRNRGNSNFVVSIGDEPMPPLPLSEEPFLIGN